MTIGSGDLSSVSMIAKIGSSPLISQKKQMNTAVYFPAPNLAEVWRKSLKYKMLWFLLKPYQVWSKIVHVSSGTFVSLVDTVPVWPGFSSSDTASLEAYCIHLGWYHST